MIEVLRVITYVTAFITIWYGSGMILSSVEHLAHKLRGSSFAISFFVLGLLTSVPEFGLGVSALFANKSDIFVGDLLGGIIMLFFLAIPLLIFKYKELPLRTDLNHKTLVASLLYLCVPFILLLDRDVSLMDGAVLISLYVVLFMYIQEQHGFVNATQKVIAKTREYTIKNVLSIILGIGLVVLSSSIIIEQTTYFAQLIGLSPFIVSLVLLAIGTNIPELSLLARSKNNEDRSVIFGDYVGSATANPLLLGLFTLFSSDSVGFHNEHLEILTFLTILGFALIYFWARKRQAIGKKGAVLLLIFYVIMILSELFQQL